MKTYYIKENKEIATRSLGLSTVFRAQMSTLVCKFCGEDLGKITDDNIDHQAEYHSCPIEERE